VNEYLVKAEYGAHGAGGAGANSVGANSAQPYMLKRYSRIPGAQPQNYE